MDKLIGPKEKPVLSAEIPDNFQTSACTATIQTGHQETEEVVVLTAEFKVLTIEVEVVGIIYKRIISIKQVRRTTSDTVEKEDGVSYPVRIYLLQADNMENKVKNNQEPMNSPLESNTRRMFLKILVFKVASRPN